MRTLLILQKAHLKIIIFIKSTRTIHGCTSFSQLFCSNALNPVSVFCIFFAAIFTMRNKQRENVCNSAFFLFYLFNSQYTANHRHQCSIFVYNFAVCRAASSTVNSVVLCYFVFNELFIFTCWKNISQNKRRNKINTIFSFLLNFVQMNRSIKMNKKLFKKIIRNNKN